MYPKPIQPSYLAASNGEVDPLNAEFAGRDSSDLEQFLLLLKRHLLLIGLVALVTGAVAYAVTSRQPRQYSASATLVYVPFDPTQATDRSVATVVSIGASNAVLGPVALRENLGLGAVSAAVTISGDPNADIVTISAGSHSASQAAALANDVAQELITYSSAGQKQVLQAQLTSLEDQLQTFAGQTLPSAVSAAAGLRTQIAGASAQLAVAKPPLAVISAATTPSGSISPHPKRDAAIGFMAGLVLGVLLAILRDRLDRRIRGVEEVEATYRAPILGMVPFMKRNRRRSAMLADFSGSGELAGAYRTIRTNLALLFSLSSKKASVIVVTSATAEEGKSAVSANLAHALAVMGKNVLVVSADLHDPALHEYFEARLTEDVAARRPTLAQRISASSTVELNRAGREPSGLVEVLSRGVPLSDAVRAVQLTEPERASGGSLDLLANTMKFFDPASLFESEPMQAFQNLVRDKYDAIVLDTPPLLANSDAALLAQGADALVLVARLEHLTKNQARRAVRIMSTTHLSPTGVIVTGDLGELSYGYGYGYRESSEEATTSSADQLAGTSF